MFSGNLTRRFHEATFNIFHYLKNNIFVFPNVSITYNIFDCVHINYNLNDLLHLLNLFNCKYILDYILDISNIF